MSTEGDTLKHQMEAMQSQLAFQEDALRSLDEALARQQQEILLLRRQLELLRQRDQEHATYHDTGLASVPLDDKPPHY
jgi:SlyX protein